MTSGISPSFRSRGASSSRGAKGILQSNPKYQATTVRVLALANNKPTSIADKRDDLPQERGVVMTTAAATTETATSVETTTTTTTIPDLFIRTIVEGFGEDADLYKDILHATPNPESRQLRICYFRRGREVLTEGGVNGLGGLASGDDVSELTKIRFQAVSMAYEIVSNPAWRAIYIKEGLKLSPEEENSESSSTLKQQPASSSRLSKVKWNERVEELIFDLEPDEKKVPFQRKKSRSKRNKAKIFIEENAELDEHLAMLDAEAQPHFVTDFFDNLEESLDGLLKFAKSSTEEPSSSKSSLSRKDNDNDQSSLTSGGDREPGPMIQRVTSNDEDSLAGMFATHILGMPLASSPGTPSQSFFTGNNPNQVSPDSTSLVPLSHSEAKSPVPFRCVSPDPCREDDVFDVLEDMALSPTSSVSSGKQYAKKNVINNEEEEDDDDDEDVFDGIFEEEKPSSIVLPRNHRPISPANCSMTSMVSELSESVAQSPAPFELFLLKPDESNSDEPFNVPEDSNNPNTPLSVEALFKDMPDEEFFEDTWCQPSQVAKSLPFGAYDPEEGEEKTTTDEGDIPMKSNLPSSDQDGLLQVFRTFIMTMVADCESMGNNMSEIDWKNAVLGAFTVEDEEVMQLMEIVATEVNKAPTLHAQDAVGSSTLLVIETARSFS